MLYPKSKCELKLEEGTLDRLVELRDENAFLLRQNRKLSELLKKVVSGTKITKSDLEDELLQPLSGKKTSRSRKGLRTQFKDTPVMIE